MQNHEKILSGLDPATKYIKVETKIGDVKWREVPGSVLETDVIVFRKNGEPYQMTRKPGRKKKNKAGQSKKPRAINGSGEKLDLLYKKRKSHLQKSRFLQTIRESPESITVLKHIMEGIAGEIESMSFDRDMSEQKGESTSMISNRIIQGYKAIGEAWLKRKDQISDSELDLTSPAFKNLLQLIIETIKECMYLAEIPQEEIKLVLTKTGQMMNTEAWIIRARKRMRGEDDASTR